MKRWNPILTITALAAPFLVVPAAKAAPVAMDTTLTTDADDENAVLPYLQCVPYARQVSGIQLFGDAHTWWDQAEGKYARGRTPRIGAVMSFHAHGGMVLGHVAAISRVLDSRTVLLRHANWSPINGHRGQIENDVRAVDVSPDNDWSEVRVWYAPLGDLGTTHWPVDGFIYNRKPALAEKPVTLALAETARPARGRIDGDFLRGITFETPARKPATSQSAVRQLSYRQPAAAPTRAVAAPLVASATTVAANTPRSLRNDPIGRIIASRMK